MTPIYTAFYTRGTIYEQEAARLRDSLDRFKLPHDIRAIDSVGDWVANSRYTATHVLTMMDAYPDRPVVQLDADALVCRVPELFEQGLPCDVAAHVRRGKELLNGTLYVAPTHAARNVILSYRDGVAADVHGTNEQRWLQAAVAGLAGQFEFFDLPPGYCYIPDIMVGDLMTDEEVVIGQLQASREGRNCGALPNRKQWLADLGKAMSAKGKKPCAA